jgi:hypothetical protein
MQTDMECTMWPEGWWHHCCVAHDFGASDADLAACVVQSAPSAILGAIAALVMVVGLQLFRPIWRRLTRR